MNRNERLERNTFENPAQGFRDLIGLRRTFRIFFAFLLVHLAYFSPVFIKNSLLRLSGMKIGSNTMIAPTFGLDFTYPDKLSVGDNTVIGYGATLLSHEITAGKLRHGPTEIGDNVLIGANSTVLPGVKIGDNATVAAGAVVMKDVEEGQRVGGVPARPLKDISEDQER